MRRFLTFALPLALVMGLSTTSFGAVQGTFTGANDGTNNGEYSFDLGGPYSLVEDDVISADLALPYMVEMNGFTFSAHFTSDDNFTWAAESILTISDSAGTEHFVVGAGGDDSWDSSWEDESTRTVSQTFTFPTLSLSGELDTYITVDFQQEFGEATWDDVSFVANVTAVPEPASAGLLGLGALVMLRRRRRTRVA